MLTDLGEDIESRGPSCLAAGNTKWRVRFGQESLAVPQKGKRGCSKILLLGIYTQQR